MYRKETFRQIEDTQCFSNGKYCPGLISHFTEMYSKSYISQSIATGEQTHVDHSSKTLGFKYKCWTHFTDLTRIVSQSFTQKLGFCQWCQLKRKLVIFGSISTAHHSGAGFACSQRVRSSDTSGGCDCCHSHPPMAPVAPMSVPRLCPGPTCGFTSLFNFNMCKCLPNHGRNGEQWHSRHQ